MNNLINIEFPYNGNLGILQQKTIDNKVFCNRLMQNGIIDCEEWRETMQKIQAYFEQEIAKVIEQSCNYTKAFEK